MSRGGQQLVTNCRGAVTWFTTLPGTIILSSVLSIVFFVALA